jgi:hypothetical protein
MVKLRITGFEPPVLVPAPDDVDEPEVDDAVDPLDPEELDDDVLEIPLVPVDELLELEADLELELELELDAVLEVDDDPAFFVVFELVVVVVVPLAPDDPVVP